MNRGLKMALLNNKVKEGQRGRENVQEYQGGRGMQYSQGNEGGSMHYPMPWPPYGEEGQMRMERGGNRGGNRGAYDGYEEGQRMEGGAESRRYRDERGRYTSRPGRRAGYEDGREMRYDENGSEMRRIGFQNEPWEEQGKEREQRTRSEYGGNIIPMRQRSKGEDDEEDDPARTGKRQQVRAGGTFWMDTPENEKMPITRQKAREWVGMMKSSDPSRPQGGKWSMEEVKPYAQKVGIPTDGQEFFEFFAIMNAMYSDYYEVAKKYNLHNNPTYFADLAKAWLHDEDAVENKAAMYYECIVKH